MTIQEYINHLEITKNNLLALNLPLNTKLVNPPDMGVLIAYNEPKYYFAVITAFKRNNCHFKYEFVGNERLTETEQVVEVNYGGW